jgi:type IV secretion system protein VirD4
VNRADDRWAPLEALALAALILLLTVCALLWLTFQLAALVSGEGPLPLVAADLPPALLRLPSHARDPRQALPPDAAAVAPGAPAVYASMIVLLGAALGLALAAQRLLHRPPRADGARLATGRDLCGLLSRTPVPGRLTLGRHGRRLVVAEPRHSLLVVGPPQTGKTTALAIPAILEWPGPVVVTSSKTDVLEVTRAARTRRGEVMIYDPTGDTESSVGWTPLASVHDWGTAQAAAHALLSARRGLDGMNESTFWNASAEMMIAPLLLAAHLTQAGMAGVVAWLDAGPQADEDIHAALGGSPEPLAASAWTAVTAMDPRTRMNVAATARTVLAAWWDPRVLGLARPELTPQRLLSGSGSLFLVASAHHQQRLQSVLAAIISEITNAVYEHRARTGERLERGLLLVLDEAAHIAPVRNLPELAATGPEPGIQLISVFQDLAQIRIVYGQAAPTVVANHRARIYLPGIGDPDTLTDLARTFGDAVAERIQVTTGPSGTAVTTAQERRPLLAPNQLRELRTGEALLLYGSRPPAKLTLRHWYRER